MKRTVLSRASLAFWVPALLLAGVALAWAATSARASDPDEAKAELIDTNLNEVGEVKLDEDDGVLEVRVEVGLPSSFAGFHGFHVHGTGQCVDPATGLANFGLAGTHHNPGGADHPGHAGDMPVLLVNADGTAEARFVTDRLEIASLLEGNGSAIIIHADPDDYRQPATGNAGARIACGVIEED